MIQETHEVDEDGNPAGGTTVGTGINVRWQNGPLGRGADRVPPNGAFIEDLLLAVIGRLRFYQTASDGRFACRENALMLTHCEEALHWEQARTAAREEAGVEGTHATH